jgi:hypothetical protein
VDEHGLVEPGRIEQPRGDKVAAGQHLARGLRECTLVNVGEGHAAELEEQNDQCRKPCKRQQATVVLHQRVRV